MSKDKLKRFAEIETFHNFLHPTMEEIKRGLKLKGNWNRDFFKNSHPIILELGCGKGEFTVGLAQSYPNRNFIGIDIKGARMWRGAKTAVESELNNVGFLRTRIELIESCFGPDEIDEIWITFPDPQPKNKIIKKRLTAPGFINKYKRFLKPAGLIHLKTDSRILYDYTLEVIEEFSHHLVLNTDDLYLHKESLDAKEIQTFYEEKYLVEGIPINYIQFQLNDNNE